MGKKILDFILFHVVAFLIAWILYIGLINSVLFNFIEIYFYKSIVILIVVALAALSIEVIIKIFWKKAIYDFKDIIISFMVILCVNMVWLSSAVVSLDRSLSVFILSYMAKEERNYSEKEIEEVFQKIFVDKYGMLDRRFWEQIESGNIESSENGYKLTERGKWFSDVFKAVGKIYNVDDRFINPK